MHHPPHDITGSRRWEAYALPGLIAVGVIALYPASMMGAAGWAILVLLMGGGALFIARQHRLSRRAITDAWEREALAAQVEEAQVNYRSIFDNAAQGIFQSTAEGSFITANPALARMFGMETPEELISEMSGWPARHFFSDPVRWAEMIQFILWQDSVADFEAEVVRKDGRTIWISQNIHAVWDGEDNISYLEGTIFDITERHWAERRRALQYAAAKILRDCSSVAEARPRILQSICELLEWEIGAVWDVVQSENVLKCVEIWHRQGVDIREFESASQEMTFAPGMRLAGKVWQSGEPAWVVDFSEEEFSLNALVAARHGMNSAFGIPIKVGGEVMHVLEFFSPKTSQPDPELLQMLGIVANQIGHLMERKLAEETLRDTVVRKTAILESALDPIITFDHEGKVVEWNPAAERTFGYRRADVLGTGLAELILPASARCGPESGPGGGLPLCTAETAFGRRSEIVAIRSDGREFQAEIAIAKAPLLGKPLFTAYLRDITELKRAEQLRGELEAIARASESAIFSTTAAGNIVLWNPEAQRIFGYEATEISGRFASVLVPPDRLEAFEGELESLRQGNPVENRETVRRRKDGSLVSVSQSEIPICNDRGLVTGMLFKVREIAGEAQGVESDLLQSQKMEAVGRLAGGVAHDFNNILTAILGYADLVLPQIPPGTPVHEGVCEIRKAGQFAASLTHQLLAFSRGQALELTVLDLNEIVVGIQPMLRRLVGDSIRIVATPSGEPAMVQGDPGELEQVILNLALNARDAMPSGGVIFIDAARVAIQPGSADPGMGVPPGNWVKLVVRDTGIGMSEAVRKHVFEPFFTTKVRGRGTGLGLATCYGIVKHSAGHIICNSTPGLGTTFQIFLPFVEMPSGGLSRLENEFKGLEVPLGTETILLVEDEESVRRLTVDILQRLGYTILEADNAEAARAIVKADPGRKIDLLLADVVESGGKELAVWLHESHPGIRILLTSGYVEEVVFSDGTLEPETAHLQKPFTPATLANKVREVLEGGETGVSNR